MLNTLLFVPRGPNVRLRETYYYSVSKLDLMQVKVSELLKVMRFVNKLFNPKFFQFF